MAASPDQIAAEAYHAYASTRFYLRSTPCEPAEWLKRAMSLQAAATAAAAVDGAKDATTAPQTPSAVFIKLESEQRTGSFKARGALNAVLRALRDPKSGTAAAVEGFTTASTGNHALATIFAVGQAASLVSSPLELRIFVAQNADPTKLARLNAAAQASNGRCSVVVEGRDCCEAEKAARRAAAERKGLRYLSPYNDADVIAGQGSLAVELLSQLRGGGAGRHRGRGGDDDPKLAVFVPVGGGGLIAGVAAVLKSALDSPGRCAVYGCQPAANDVMRRSVVDGGKLLDLPAVAEAPTLSDATAGGVEPGSLTFDLCRDLVDHWVTLSESEIADGMISCLEHGGKLVEGAAGCAVAAALKVGRERPEELAGRTVVVVACGGNVGVAALKEALELGRAVEV